MKISTSKANLASLASHASHASHASLAQSPPNDTFPVENSSLML